ncbi:hypothetical protein BBI10_24180 [Pseudomonas graminis]|uniref:Uncharacterized protein n=1 Tax=Pseudomonas graminis TaxID=158627 RepID=A0A1C2D9F0_9PSED|nr:hypothetical protein BBI10_24180 [Pseudomonas graminis]
MAVPDTGGVPVMAVAIGTVEGVGTMAGVAITVAATAIVHRPQVRDPAAAMAPAQAAVGMAILAAVVAAARVPALAPGEAATEETAASAVAATADRAAATAESQQNGAPRSAVFYGMNLTVEVYHLTLPRLKPVLLKGTDLFTTLHRKLICPRLLKIK